MPSFLFTRANIPFALIFLYWYGMLSILAIINYVSYIRQQYRHFDRNEDVINAYLAFCILGMICYAGITGPSFFQAHKYATTYKARNRQIQLGLLAIYFIETFPMFFIELYLVYFFGIGTVIQGMLFFLQFMTVVVGSIMVWFIYMWRVAKLLHHKTGLARDAQLAVARQQLRLQPPVPSTKPLPGQPRVI